MQQSCGAIGKEKHVSEFFVESFEVTLSEGAQSSTVNIAVRSNWHTHVVEVARTGGGVSSINLVKDSRHGQFFIPMVLHRTLSSPKISSVLEGTSQVLGFNYLFGSPVITKFRKQES